MLRRSFVIFVLFAAISGNTFAAKWHVPDATIRFQLQTGNGPTSPQNGYIVDVPDGGVLPKPYAQPTVIVDNGGEAKIIKSYVLWQNKRHGCALVLEQPPIGTEAYVYFSPTEEVRKWTEATGLKPGPFLVVQQGVSTREANLKLAEMGVVPESVHWRMQSGKWRTAVTVLGDMTGYTGPVSAYQMFYYKALDPGETKFCKMPYMGRHHIRVNGKFIALETFSGKRGGRGGSAGNLQAGQHKVEIMCFDVGGHAPFRGLVALGVITPNTRPNQMGGINHTGDGKPFWACRLVSFGEVAWSGRTSIIGASMRDGSPVANIISRPIENFWFPPEKPTLVYKLQANTKWYSENARFYWQFEGGAIQEKPEINWIFGGERHHIVTLTVEDGGKSSSCRQKIYPYAPETMIQSSLNNPQTPENYRQAVFDMFNAYPADKDPTTSWDQSYWNNLFRVIDLNMAKPLLSHMVNVRWPIMQKHADDKNIKLIRDYCIDFAPRLSPQLGLKWTRMFEEMATDERDKAALRLERADIFLFYLEDIERAKQMYTEEARKRIRDPVGELALIRLGDIAFIQGEVNEARQLYATVQARAKHKKKKAEAKAAKEAVNVAEWKADAFLSASAAETASSYLAQGYQADAKQALREWELEFPLNKINGDFILNEARFYLSLEDYQRAKIMLEAYCDYVDTSSFLPDSCKVLLLCKRTLKEPPDDIVAWCEKQAGKMKFHPVARELDYYIKMQKGELKTGTEAGGGGGADMKKASTVDKARLLQEAMKGNK